LFLIWQELAWYVKLDAVPFLVGLDTLIVYLWVQFLSASACVVLLPLYLIFITAVVCIIDAMQIIIISHYCFLYMPVALFNFHIFTGVILYRLKLIFCD
jgi:hypothetical protein